MYVIVRGDGEFVTPPGREHSYTRDVLKAWVFARRACAEGNACGNERVRAVADLFYEGVTP
jgi:hypothetical protein